MRNTIITVVASSDMMGQLSAFWAFAKMVVFLAAPGDHILLFHVAVKNGYKYDSGTSFAAAHVTWVLACISALHGTTHIYNNAMSCIHTQIRQPFIQLARIIPFKLCIYINTYIYSFSR